MARPTTSLLLRPISRSSNLLTTCLFCQHRLIHRSASRLQSTTSSTTPKATASPPTTSKVTKTSPPAATVSGKVGPIPQRRDRPHVRAYDGELVPQPLNRPLGLPFPPQPGQNSGVDTRTWKQKREDFASYDKHIERRQNLIKNLYEKNYFRDIGNLGKIHKGKSILAPTTPFRSNLALYFPNLQGKTLLPSGPVASDTTPVLRGRVSVVSMLNSEWGRGQCQSFVSEKTNPELQKVLSANEAVAQMVELNVEDNPLKRWLIRVCMPFVRRRIPEKDWGRYFLVGTGVDDEIKEAMGIWNSKVGYVYLVDGNCKVRWAGNGDAREDERTSLVNCLRRLVDEARGMKGGKTGTGTGTRVVRQDARPTGKVEETAQDGERRVAVAA